MKTSGADGIHVVAPITRRSTFQQTYDFAEGASRLLEARHPGHVTTEWLKKKREGVLVDHRQNGWGKTIASVYSVRPKPGAPVSTPLRWDELRKGIMARDFTMDVALHVARTTATCSRRRWRTRVRSRPRRGRSQSSPEKGRPARCPGRAVFCSGSRRRARRWGSPSALASLPPLGVTHLQHAEAGEDEEADSRTAGARSP